MKVLVPVEADRQIRESIVLGHWKYHQGQYLDKFKGKTLRFKLSEDFLYREDLEKEIPRTGIPRELREL